MTAACSPDVPTLNSWTSKRSPSFLRIQQTLHSSCLLGSIVRNSGIPAELHKKVSSETFCDFFCLFLWAAGELESFNHFESYESTPNFPSRGKSSCLMMSPVNSSWDQRVTVLLPKSLPSTEPPTESQLMRERRERWAELKPRWKWQNGWIYCTTKEKAGSLNSMP